MHNTFTKLDIQAINIVQHPFHQNQCTHTPDCQGQCPSIELLTQLCSANGITVLPDARAKCAYICIQITYNHMIIQLA